MSKASNEVERIVKRWMWKESLGWAATTFVLMVAAFTLGFLLGVVAL